MKFPFAFGYAPLLALVYLAATPPGHAAGDETIEEIVVTATRRDASIQDVSGSVSALTSEDIAMRGIDDLQTLTRGVPGVLLLEPLKNRSTFTIRGINTDVGETQLTQEPVSLYINEMPATSPFAELVQPDLRLYDIERVEFLRGPQGTLFGSGSLAGTVRVITRAPVLNKREAAVRLDIADVTDGGSRQRIDAMLNVPLLEDRLAMRAVAYARDASGWVDNLTLGTTNSSDDRGGRLALLWRPNDALDVRLELLYQDSNPGDSGAWNPALGKYKRASEITERRKAELSLYNLTLDYALTDSIQLMSSTNFKTVDTDWLQDVGPFPGIGDLINESPFFLNDSFAQEFRLVSAGDGNLNWVAGAYFFDSKTDSRFRFQLRGLQDFVEQILGPGAMTNESLFAGDVILKSQELAAYADADYRLNDTWTVTAGVRVFDTESVYTQTNGAGFDFATLSDIQFPDFTNKATDSDWTWRTVIAWKPRENRHYYFSLSKGYRVGQVNPNSGPSFVDPNDIVIAPTYDSDASLNIELGTKTTWMNGRLQANTALYYIRWTDIQVDATRSSDQLSFISNAGEAISKGLELEIAALPLDSLDLRMALAWQDASIDIISGGNSFLSGALPGDTLPGAAKFIGSISAQYLRELSADRQLRLQAGAYFTDSSPNRFSFGAGTGQPNADFAISESFTTIDASISLLTARWAFSLYGENLGDNDNTILNVGASLKNPVVALQPRTIGLRAEYRY